MLREGLAPSNVVGFIQRAMTQFQNAIPLRKQRDELAQWSDTPRNRGCVS
jgi:hypothetical protein